MTQPPEQSTLADLAARNDASVAAEIKAMGPAELRATALNMQKAYDDLVRRCEDAIDAIDGALGMVVSGRSQAWRAWRALKEEVGYGL